jgi:hypothetical protein
MSPGSRIDHSNDEDIVEAAYQAMAEVFFDVEGDDDEPRR